MSTTEKQQQHNSNNTFIATKDPWCRNKWWILSQYTESSYCHAISISCYHYMIKLLQRQHLSISAILLESDLFLSQTLVHAFILSRIDSCNVLLSDLHSCATNSLRPVQNAATRNLTKKKKREICTHNTHSGFSSLVTKQELILRFFF